MLDNILYYMSNTDEDPVVKLYVRSQLTSREVEELHNSILRQDMLCHELTINGQLYITCV